MSVYEHATAVLISGECPDCVRGALHVCPLLVRDIVAAAIAHLEAR